MVGLETHRHHHSANPARGFPRFSNRKSIPAANSLFVALRRPSRYQGDFPGEPGGRLGPERRRQMAIANHAAAAAPTAADDDDDKSDRARDDDVTLSKFRFATAA